MDVKTSDFGYLFPMGVDETELFTPPIYEERKVPVELRPKFKIRAYTQQERVKFKRLQKHASVEAKKDIEKLKLDGAVYDKDEYLTVLISHITMHMPQDEFEELTTSCIVGWSNVLDQNGKDIEYSGSVENGVDEKLKNKIPSVALDAIFDRVNIISGLTEAEKVGL